MKAIVVNCSTTTPSGRRANHYNLATYKLADWLAGLGYRVDRVDGVERVHAGYDLVALSVIFSWNAPEAARLARMLRANSDVWCGGPGMSRLASWWKRETGLDCHVGLDQRFDRQRGNYKMVFAARGCPVGCSFCIVPELEGEKFTYDWGFQPAPLLCDNNLSAQPDLYQWHTIKRYGETGVRLVDANSGFEPATFTQDTYFNWRGLIGSGPWRFALDEVCELEDVRRMMAILKDEPVSRKRVYVLVGNEPIAECYRRAMKVVEWGGEPYCQFIMPLSWLGGPRPMPHDWDETKGKDFCRYFNRFLWRYTHLRDYTNRQGERPSFAEVTL